MNFKKSQYTHKAIGAKIGKLTLLKPIGAGPTQNSYSEWTIQGYIPSKPEICFSSFWFIADTLDYLIDCYKKTLSKFDEYTDEILDDPDFTVDISQINCIT